MHFIEVRAKGQITVPSDMRADVGIREGTYVAMIADKGRLIMQPMDTDQLWFWTPEWQAGEREADRELAAGQVETFETDEEFLDSLDK